MSDDWLDAFSPDDFADRELAALDRAVDRLAPRQVPRRWGRWAIAALVAAGLALVLGAPTPQEPAPPPAPPPAPAMIVEPAGPPLPPPPPPPVRRPAPAPREAPAPGLFQGPGAHVEVAGDRATLVVGHVVYRHDAGHDPGVRAVGVEDLPVTFTPVGTVFRVEARPGVAMIAVEDGAVDVVHDDGEVLATLIAPDQALLVEAPDGGVRVIEAGGIGLSGLVSRVPDDAVCARSDVVTTISRLRLGLRQRLGIEP